MKTTPAAQPAPNQSGAGSPRTGPMPLPELPAARARVLRAVAARGDAESATVGDLAEELGGHPNTTRAHVGALVTERLLERVALAGGTRGRPAHGHRVTDRGRLVLEAAEVAEPVATDELVAAMAEHLATTPDAEAHARAIGRLWAAQLTRAATARDAEGRRSSSRPDAGGAVSPAERVVSLLSTAGFSPRREPSGAVALRTCPVLASARAHPGVVCTMHEEMLRAALDGGGVTDVQVGLVPFAREGACLVHLSRG